MDTLIIVLVFVAWLIAYDQVEKFWKEKRFSRSTLILVMLAYITGTYLLGYQLTKLI